jgi:hypothetical protein
LWIRWGVAVPCFVGSDKKFQFLPTILLGTAMCNCEAVLLKLVDLSTCNSLRVCSC